MSRIVVHIDRVVLNGYRPEDRHAIVAALQAELAELLATDEGLARVTGLATVPPQRFTTAVEHTGQPAAVGRAVADAIAGKGRR